MDGNIIDFGPVEDKSKEIIKVIGVGGGGCNAVNRMYNDKIVNVSFAVCNTDSQSLAKSPVPIKLQLGDSGLGAGANPELGRSEAINTKEQIKRLFDDNTKMCFVTAGMGGGTGTGAAPVIAGVAKSLGILTVGIVTIPFFFEKRPKIIKALYGVEEMRKNVDSLLIVNNERLCDIYSESKTSVKDAFKAADRILSDATKGISELITVEGTINLDFRDVESTMRGGGGAIMAIGRASGDHRVEKAIIDALDSPLLYGSDITKASKILFNIYTSNKAPLFVSEIQEIDSFMYELNPDIDVIWGTSDDDSLDEDAKVLILATGLDNQFAMQGVEKGTTTDNKYFDQVISKLYKEPMPNAQWPTVEPKSEVSDNIKENFEEAEKTDKIDFQIEPEHQYKNAEEPEQEVELELEPEPKQQEKPAKDSKKEEKPVIQPQETVIIEEENPYQTSGARSFINKLKKNLMRKLGDIYE